METLIVSIEFQVITVLLQFDLKLSLEFQVMDSISSYR